MNDENASEGENNHSEDTVSQWWIEVDRKPQGPHSTAYIAVLLKEGRVPDTALVCPVGGEWCTLEESNEPEFTAAKNSVNPFAPPPLPRNAGPSLVKLQLAKIASSLPPDSETLHRYFRGLLIAEIVLSVLTTILYIFDGFTSSAVIEDASGSTELSGFEVAVAILAVFLLLVYIPALITSWVGLFLLKPWARWLYLVAIVTVFLLYLPISFFDTSLTWAFPDAINGIGYLVTGSILAILFFTSVAASFRGTVIAEPTDDVT